MKALQQFLLAAAAVSAVPFAQADEFQDYGRVVRVQPRVEQVRQPRQECRTEYVEVPVQQTQRNPGGALLGAVVGGIVGNQVGHGSGRAAATAAGVIAGAMVGDKASNDRNPQVADVQEQAIRKCRTVDAWESRTVGYDVTYDYRGRSYTSTMHRDPGERVRLRVSVEPEEY